MSIVQLNMDLHCLTMDLHCMTRLGSPLYDSAWISMCVGGAQHKLSTSFILTS